MLDELRLYLPGPPKPELYALVTVFGEKGSGKSWLCRELARAHRAAGWLTVWIDPPEKNPAPAGVLRARTLEQGRKMIAGQEARACIIHAEGLDVATDGQEDPWLLDIGQVNRHDGPFIYLATQDPVSMSRQLRRYAKYSYLLPMRIHNNHEWIRRNFGDQVLERVLALPWPEDCGYISTIKATEQGGK